MADKTVNRKFDLAAFAAIVERVNDVGFITLELPTKKACEGLRLQFYRWRGQEQELNADPSFLADIVIRVEENEITFAGGLADTALRKALANAGITTFPDEEGET